MSEDFMPYGDTVDEHPHYTHRATMTVSSDGPNSDVAVQIIFDPDMKGSDIIELGYLPPAYNFIQEYLLPALEAVYMEGEYPELAGPSPSQRNH